MHDVRGRRPRFTIHPALLALLILSPDARAGAIDWSVLPAPPGQVGFGSALASLPDLDGDGRSDLAVATATGELLLFVGQDAPPVQIDPPPGATDFPRWLRARATGEGPAELLAIGAFEGDTALWRRTLTFGGPDSGWGDPAPLPAGASLLFDGSPASGGDGGHGRRPRDRRAAVRGR